MTRRLINTVPLRDPKWGLLKKYDDGLHVKFFFSPIINRHMFLVTDNRGFEEIPACDLKVPIFTENEMAEIKKEKYGKKQIRLIADEKTASRNKFTIGA